MFANTSLFQLSHIYNVRPEDIRVDGGTQSRVELNLDIVSEYAELMLSKKTANFYTAF